MNSDLGFSDEIGVLSSGGVPVDTPTKDKLIGRSENESESAGILRKSSKYIMGSFPWLSAVHTIFTCYVYEILCTGQCFYRLKV